MLFALNTFYPTVDNVLIREVADYSSGWMLDAKAREVSPYLAGISFCFANQLYCKNNITKINMTFDFSKIKKQVSEVELWLIKEFSSIRTNRATPAFLDGIKVDSYGSLMSINQIAAIAVEDARSLRISPWDHSQTKAVEKAVTSANLGVSVTVDDKGVRVIFPELSAERREQIVKLAKAKLEDARKSLRANRDEAVRDLQTKEKEGGIGEDEVFRAKADVQKLVDAANKKMERLFEKKEGEILS